MGNLNGMTETQGATIGRAKRVAGVSLIEVVIALSILGFGMLGAAAAQIAAYRSADTSRERIVAHSLARQQLESFHAMSRTAIEVIIDGAITNDPLNPIDPDPNDANNETYNRSWTIDRDTPEDNVYTILVTVGWTGALGAQTVSLETFKSEL